MNSTERFWLWAAAMALASPHFWLMKLVVDLGELVELAGGLVERQQAVLGGDRLGHAAELGHDLVHAGDRVVDVEVRQADQRGVDALLRRGLRGR
jgi:hypothetical protein